MRRFKIYDHNLYIGRIDVMNLNGHVNFYYNDKLFFMVSNLDLNNLYFIHELIYIGLQSYFETDFYYKIQEV